MKIYHISNREDIILRDYLARDRTTLANTRTFLAFVRTALGFFSAGIAGIKFIADWPVVYHICLVLLFISPLILLYGIVFYIRYILRLRTIPDNHLLRDTKDHRESSE